MFRGFGDFVNRERWFRIGDGLGLYSGISCFVNLEFEEYLLTLRLILLGESRENELLESGRFNYF